MNLELTDEQLLAVAYEFGTPAYVYDGNNIIDQYKKLTDAFKNSNTLFFYACKALTNIHILRLLQEQGANVDCSSFNEIEIALKAGFRPDQIIFTSNGVKFEEIKLAVRKGVHVNIDNISTLRKFGSEFGNTYPLSIRLRPNIMAGGNIKIATGHEKSKFGIPIEYIGTVTDLVSQFDLFIDGLHIHSGSDIADMGIYMKEVEVMLEILPKFTNVRFIDLGGGLKVPYDDLDLETDINELAIRISHLFSKYKRHDGLPYQVWFEPGKFIVSKSGYLLTTVNVLHPTPKASFACVDTGFNHLIRPMFYDAYHRITNLSNPEGQINKYHIVGNLCETDTFAEDRPISEIREGDVLAIHNTGAYGFEMSMHYNARFKPVEVLCLDKKIKLIRRRESIDDLLKTQLD